MGAHFGAAASAVIGGSALLPDMRVLERGWVSSNNILLFDDDHSATLIDTGYVKHNDQTLELVRHALDGRTLTRIVIKTLLKFHLLIVRQVGWGELIAHFSGVHYAEIVNQRYFRLPFSEFISRTVDELVAGGALELRDGVVANRDN